MVVIILLQLCPLTDIKRKVQVLDFITLSIIVFHYVYAGSMRIY